MNPTDALFDADTRHMIYVQRYGGSVSKRMVRILERAHEDVLARIAATNANSVTQKRLEVLLRQIEERMDQLRRDFGVQFKEEIGDFAEYEAGFQNRLYSEVLRDVQLQAKLQAVPLAQVRAAALSRPFQGTQLRWANAPKHADAIVKRQYARMRDEIRRGFVEGDSVSRLVQRIRAFMPMDNREAETIVRTAVNHTANVAKEMWRQDNPDVVQKVVWNSVLDGRTSAVCRGRDGMTFEVGKGPRPPAHPRCRSVMTDVIKGYPPSKKPTYTEWLRKQPPSVQAEILGVKKAKLFRDGKLSLDRFIDRQGHELTLTELAKRESAAFKEAGLDIG